MPNIKNGRAINFLETSTRFERFGAKIYSLQKRGFFAQFIAFGALAVILFGTFQAAKIISLGIRVKTSVISAADQAIMHLSDVQNSINRKDFSDLEQKLLLAHKNFIDAKQNIDDLGSMIGTILDYSSQGKSAKKLLSAGNAITTAGMRLSNFYETISAIKTTPQGFTVLSDFSQTMAAARKNLSEADANMRLAVKDLRDVKPQSIPEKFRSKFEKYKQNLVLTSEVVSQTSDLFTVFSNFLAGNNGHKTMLVLFENNNEIRPTGGFIGTYGFFRFEDGKIASQKISSVYDLDGQLPKKTAPPGPFGVGGLTDQWGLRDSNWFNDFSVSAKKAIDFYEQVGMETPDAVIAVTPEIFIDLLAITGPIELPKYNIALDANNFRSLVQLHTAQTSSSVENAPKQLLADFAPILFQKISLVQADFGSKILNAIFKNLNNKNILFYDRDQSVQQEFERYNWAGRVAGTEWDYLAIYNANLGGRKTDLDVRQSLKVTSEAQDDGSIINTLYYTREQKKDDQNSSFTNIDYARFMVPLGSKLISANGFKPRPFYRSDGSGYLQDTKRPFIIDSDLGRLDEGAKQHAESGTVITTESGKTVFANWIEVQPGHQAVAVIKYKLPFNANHSLRHSVLFQKQPGNGSLDLQYNFVGQKKISWAMPNLHLNDNRVEFTGEFSSDLFFGFVY